MSFREGFDYLWTYYRIPFFVTVFCLVCLISLLSGLIKGNLSHPVLTVAVTEQLDMFYGDDIAHLLEDTFPESTGFSAPEKLSVTTPANTSNPYGPVQLTAYLSTGSFDALICDQATLDYIREHNIDCSVTDISTSELGKKAETLEISPLYYVVMDQTGHRQEAGVLLTHINSINREVNESHEK